VPNARHPGQSAADHIGPDQIAASLPSVGTGRGAIDVDAGAGQNGQTELVGGDVTSGVTAAAFKGQFQSVGAVLHVYYAGDLVEKSVVGKNRGIVKLAGAARLAKSAIVIEHHAISIVIGPVQILVALRVPQAVIVNDRAVLAAPNLPAR